MAGQYEENLTFPNHILHYCNCKNMFDLTERNQIPHDLKSSKIYVHDTHHRVIRRTQCGWLLAILDLTTINSISFSHICESKQVKNSKKLWCW